MGAHDLLRGWLGEGFQAKKDLEGLRRQNAVLKSVLNATLITLQAILGEHAKYGHLTVECLDAVAACGEKLVKSLEALKEG